MALMHPQHFFYTNSFLLSLAPLALKRPCNPIIAKPHLSLPGFFFGLCVCLHLSFALAFCFGMYLSCACILLLYLSILLLAKALRLLFVDSSARIFMNFFLHARYCSCYRCTLTTKSYCVSCFLFLVFRFLYGDGGDDGHGDACKYSSYFNC